MNKKLEPQNWEHWIDTPALLAYKIDILSKRLKDLEILNYGLSASYNADGRMVSTGTATPLTRTYASSSALHGGGYFIYAPGGLLTQSFGGSTLHFSWVEDSYGNSLLQSSFTTTP